MGVALLLVGYIQEAWPGMAGDDDEKQRKVHIINFIAEHTNSVLSALPDEDGTPPLCTPMFGWPRSKATGITYENRIIHFAASMKNADFVLRDWMDKFEALLKRLYWEEEYVRVERGYIGAHEFRWKPKKSWISALHSGRLAPITEWDFTTTLDRLESLRERISAS